MKRFLVLQLRPERDASDAEYAAFLQKGGLEAARTHRIRLDAEALPPDLDPAEYAGVIVGGGPGCVSDAPEDKSPEHARIEAAVLSLMPRITDCDLPFLGCCYGIGILGKHLGAAVGKGRYGEPVGTADCTVTEEGRADPLLAGLPARFDAFVGHKEALEELPQGCAHLLAAPSCPFQMVRHGQNVYATQFHPEADADIFRERIEIYRHHGYFPPDRAGDLIAMCRAANVHAPELILRNFIRRYG
ncbi:glutamine amidotransferase [Pelagivirga sediminicola]|uniref:Glutamine amidotransferase n=1 Tax=Pelagivirga sediminicola TaxID=2170575 RepID=A0A2T7G5P8_9RHOB|nr:glutamine amidotransferase [Pelagivirga sediminicola]PVA09745.1 glutamine amidotransferase [Pelagivirga sediminicola]